MNKINKQPYVTQPHLRVAYLMGLRCPPGRVDGLVLSVVSGNCMLAGPPESPHHRQFMAALRRGLRDR